LPHLKRWDLYLHSTSAPKAVRNRSDYLQELLLSVEDSSASKPKVLNIGSGPARDLKQYFSLFPSTRLTIDCVDMEPKAISYAKELINGINHCVNWHCKNILRYSTNERYDLVWSAGLFDYLNDKQFIFLLKRLCEMMNDHGRLVVGNFSPNNPTKSNMEFGEWFINHRSEKELFALATECGIKAKYIKTEREPEMVNLFLTIENH
jgi:extracellular factor (EF) 3-hydroxypalmitic acid methyl ester biosynthesis protein